MTKKKQYNRLTPLMIVHLAAPHTWPGASVLPPVFAAIWVMVHDYSFHVPVFILLLACSVLAQSAVNTLNDWSDYRKGTDTVENSDDPSDAVLVYDNPNPQHVLVLGICFMCACAICGLLATWWSGSFIPVLIGIIGALVIVLYSSGKFPISHLPLGEVVSGVVMGCLIPLTIEIIFVSYSLKASGFELFVVWNFSQWLDAILSTAPFVLGIGLINATQNNCDIERDILVGRKTLPVLLGRMRSLVTYRVFIVLWIATSLHFSFWVAGFSALWVAVICILFGLGSIGKLFTLPMVAQVRGLAMGSIIKANLFINGAYILALIYSLIQV